MHYIKSLELKAKIDKNENIVVIDVREPYELDICKLNVIHIPMAEITRHISTLNRAIETVFICRTGKRAEAVANLLIQEYDFLNVKVLEGGMMSWIENVDSNLEAY